MTERQVKLRMTKLDKLTQELEFLNDSGTAKSEYLDELKEKIVKIQKELIEDTTAPIHPAYLYDVESGAYKRFPEREVE